ncbi:MAG: hypothetical protein V2A34_05655 [Lentisphaerota bacterium]
MKSDIDNVAVVVPARLGSNRVKAKNLRLLNGRPLITYILGHLKQTRHLRDIYINSDSDLFRRIADEEGVKFYQRPRELATSKSLIDEYIYDFIQHVKPAHLAVVNPTSPFIGAEQLDRAWEQYCQSDCATQLSCERIQTHCFYQGRPINFSTEGKHPRSQDLTPVLALNFAITIWDCRPFVAQYERLGHGVYTHPLGFFETEGHASVDIDYEEDFAFAELVARFIEQGSPISAAYPDYAEAYFREHGDTRT